MDTNNETGRKDDLRTLAEKALHDHEPVQWITRGAFGSFYWKCPVDEARSARDIKKPDDLCGAVRMARAALDTLDAQAAELERLRRVEAAARSFIMGIDSGLFPAYGDRLAALRQALEDDHAE